MRVLAVFDEELLNMRTYSEVILLSNKKLFIIQTSRIAVQSMKPWASICRICKLDFMAKYWLYTSKYVPCMGLIHSDLKVQPSIFFFSYNIALFFLFLEEEEKKSITPLPIISMNLSTMKRKSQKL